MLIHQLLENRAAAAPERELLVTREDRASYGEIDTKAAGVAAALAAAGVEPGDRVVLLARNSVLYVAAYYGILKRGAIAVPLNTAVDAPLAIELVRDAGARALIAGTGFTPLAIELSGHVPDLETVVIEACDDVPGERVLTFADFLATSHSSAPPTTRDEREPAMIVYTSGSTGRPRGATLSHRNVVANTRSIVDYLELDADDRVLDVLPFHYVYGKSLLNTHVAVGGAVVVEESLLFPDAVLDRIDEERATGFAGVPSTFAILLARSSIAERELPSLRYLTQAGGAMSVEHTKRLIDALPGKAIFIMYGATEATARLTYLPPEELQRKLGTIGRAIPGVELDVVTEDGRVAEAGEVGEIVARGANVMLGYWNDPQETARVMGERGLHTGDLARADEEGYLTIVGRKRDMIKSGANRVAALEVEDAIVAHPDVEEAAVIGVTDELLGEAIHAFVTRRPGAKAGEDDVLEYLRERLPTYKVPKLLIVLDELPRTGSGKVDKESLRRARAR